MKTKIQIIFVRPDEEITSLLSRVSSVTAFNLVLVFPSESLILKNLVALRLLRQETEESNKNTLVVTGDETAQWLAEQAGFETVSALPDFEVPYGNN